MLEDRWCQRRGIVLVSQVFGGDLSHDGFDAGFGGVADIDVVGARLFESEADMFTAPGNARPVDELVGRVFGRLLALR